MFDRRSFLLMSSAGLVAGCQSTTADSSLEGQAPHSVFAVSAEKQGLRGNRPASDRSDTVEVSDETRQQAAKVVAPARARARAAHITRVEVDVSRASARQLRGYTFTDTRAEALLRKGIVDAVAGMNPGGAPAALEVSMTRLYVPNPSTALVGGNYPYATALSRVRDLRSGEVLATLMGRVGGVKASGGKFRPGIFGVAMREGEEQDFANLAAALGNEIREAILTAEG